MVLMNRQGLCGSMVISFLLSLVYLEPILLCDQIYVYKMAHNSITLCTQPLISGWNVVMLYYVHILSFVIHQFNVYLKWFQFSLYRAKLTIQFHHSVIKGLFYHNFPRDMSVFVLEFYAWFVCSFVCLCVLYAVLFNVHFNLRKLTFYSGYVSQNDMNLNENN